MKTEFTNAKNSNELVDKNNNPRGQNAYDLMISKLIKAKLTLANNA